MKKFLSFLLTFAMLFSLAMPAMAAEGDTYTYYIDISQVFDISKTVDYVLIVDSNSSQSCWAYPVSDSVYSFTLPTSMPSGYFTITSSDTASFHGVFIPRDTTKNLYTPTDAGNGTWSVYGDSAGAPIINGSTTGDVTATFDPDITITGVSYSGDNIIYIPEIDCYALPIPADLSDEDYVPYSIVVAGTNLQYIPEPDWEADLEEVQEDLWLKFCPDNNEDDAEKAPLSYLLSDESYDPTDGTLIVPMGANLSEVGTTLNLSYSNNNSNGNGDWSDTVSLAFRTGYSVKVNETENGTVTVPFSEYTYAGHFVNLTVTPEVGYELDTLSITGPDGEISYTKNADQYSFSMPAYNVTVSATFKERTTEPTIKTIYFDNTDGWENVYAYAFSTNPNTNPTTTFYLGNWPGTKMNKVEGTESIYAIDVFSDAVGVGTIVFNDGGHDTHSDDLTIPTDDKNLYTYSTREWSVYDPVVSTIAKITGVSITVDGDTYYSSTADNPVVITPTSEVTITVTGTNLQNGTGDNCVSYSSGTCITMQTGIFTWNVSDDGTEASRTIKIFEFETTTTAHEIKYSNTGGFFDDDPGIGTGIYVIYSGLPEDELCTVTGVEITTGYASYDDTSKTYTITPTSGDVTIKITGTNFINLSRTYVYIPGYGDAEVCSDTWTIDTENNVATYTIRNDWIRNMETAEEFKVTVRDETASLGVYMIYQSDIISVDITWGAMSFTYDDTVAKGETEETGWTCDDGANKITVTNNSTMAVNAAVSYAKADGFDWINGSFQNAAEESVTNANVAASDSYAFYLILSGKPETALDNATIGSVTVTITKATTSE